MAKESPKTKWSQKLRSALGRTKYLAGAPVRWLQNFSVHPIGWLQGGPAPAIARMHRLYELTPEVVLAGYIQGAFPTGEPNGSIVWHCPEVRGVIDPATVHVSKRLRGYLNKSELEIRYDGAFAQVIEGCADREKTWITQDINRVYQDLYAMGYVHCVEAWKGDRLVGGGYGVALGKVFFLESMFCRQDHASKIAFVSLARKLKADGFVAIDCQFLTEHWRRFGAEPMARTRFQSIVTLSLNAPAKFSAVVQREETENDPYFHQAVSAV